MIRVRQVKVSLDGDILSSIAKKINIKQSDILNYEIIKESVDSRHKDNILLIYEVDVNIKDETKVKLSNDVLISYKKQYSFKPSGSEKLINRPLIIGAGPAGLFASYMLALEGYKPIVIERGSKVEERLKDVDDFLKTGVLNPNSNVQFGEGGAGTFSDGKLNTSVKDPLQRNDFILKTFVKFGAPKEIIYKAKPHIGTDILITVIKNMREEIIRLGGSFRYNTTLNDLVIENNKLLKAKINDEYIDAEVLILAIGHSARDTFYKLNEYLNMEAKPFAVGLRISHNQKMIDESQYGKVIDKLGPASYKLTYQTKEGRGVYTFCMCPGGYVINSSSEDSMLAINGMSNHARSSGVANSAIIVTVTPKDFGTNPLDGIKYQRDLESKAYKLCNGKIPIQLYKDFKDNTPSVKLGTVSPMIKGEYAFSNINDILPDYISSSIKEGIEDFGRKIQGFNSGDAILAAFESRSSSPVRILRNEEYESSISGIYPCGEGAGYAGGITSAAMDGIKVAEAIMKKFSSF